MKLKKENLSLFLFALSVLVIIPFFVSFIPTSDKNQNRPSESIGINESHNSLQDIPTSSFPIGTTPVKSADLSGQTFTNYTKYSVEENDLKFKPQAHEDGKPIILIIHTYGTQGYLTEDYITEQTTLKSEDENLNVVGIGETLKDFLAEKGIYAIHDKTLYDKISYSNAYNLSINSVKEHIEKYPSIRYVIDIQRDSVFAQNGSCIKSVTDTKKGKTAQISFIAGCDENGADFPHWKKNLSLSFALSKTLSEISPKLSRGVFLFPSGYGQYTSEGFITVEIGTSGNTPSEAKNCAYYLSEALHKVLDV